MKKWNSALWVLLSACFLNACGKSSDKLSGNQEASGDKARLIAKEPTPRVKAMINDYSETRFYYNREGGIDSVVKTVRGADYERFIIHGKGKLTDSIKRYSQGKLIGKWDDIQYNMQERITAFTRRTIGSPKMYTRFLLEYDKNGDIKTQRMESSGTTKVENFYEYNQDHDLVGNNHVVNGLEHIYSFRGDNHLNPLYQTDLFYIIFELLDEQPLLLSKHNITEMIYEGNGTIWKFVNEYDQYNRLIKRNNLRTGDYYIFTYY